MLTILICSAITILLSNAGVLFIANRRINKVIREKEEVLSLLTKAEEELAKWKPAPVEDDGEGYW